MGSDLKKIHAASVRLLEEIGIKLHHPEVLERIAGFGIKVEGQTAYFTEKQLRHWVNLAPGRFTLSALNPEHDMFVGGDSIEYAAGYGAPTIVDPEGNRRAALMEDYIQFLKLVNQSPYFHLNGGILVQPMDLLDLPCFPTMLYASILYSDKCLMGFQSNRRTMEQLMDMVAICFGGKDKLLEQPRLISMISTMSPLQVDSEALDTLLVCAGYRQPVIISPGPAAGSTGPVTMAGNVSLANAEALAVIAISQMIQPGTPVVYGLQSTAADLRSGGISVGSPAYSIQAAYCARLARMYGIPSRTGGTNNDAKGVSVQSGYESMFSMLNACLHNVNLIVHSAGMLDSYAATSYGQFMVDLEIISMIEFYLQGLETDQESFAFDVIKDVGSGGEFLSSEHTLLHFRTDTWNPLIGLRGNIKGMTPNEKFLFNINKAMNGMLESYEKPPYDPAMLESLEAYMIQEVGLDQAVLASIRGEAPAQNADSGESSPRAA